MRRIFRPVGAIVDLHDFIGYVQKRLTCFKVRFFLHTRGIYYITATLLMNKEQSDFAIPIAKSIF
jgi:hypothetical protein